MMKNYSELAMFGILVCGVVLSADALYFNTMNMYLSNGLVFLVLVVCSAYLLRLAHEGNKTVDSSFEKTSAFHVQLGTEIAEQLSSAHTELGNTQAILSDAIGKLVSNFILISDGVRDLSEHTNGFSKQIRDVVEKTSSSLAVAEQTLSNLAADDRAAAMKSIQHVRTIMADLAAFNEAVAKNAIDLNFISTNVEQNVLVVISTLQFQDMSSQLIEHARLRMTALQEVANEMGKGAGTGNGGRPSRREYLEQIAAYNRLLDKHVVSLDKQKASPVKQKDFGTGDIELF
jgi:methyl-accepting chemotaxis protein